MRSVVGNCNYPPFKSVSGTVQYDMVKMVYAFFVSRSCNWASLEKISYYMLDII